MASVEVSNPPSPTPSNASVSSSRSFSRSSSRSLSPLPEALALGREKRATAGNKLRALLDAEFQEEEIFKEDEDDQEFEREKSDEGEEYISSSESSSDEEGDQQDEEEGEKALLAQQKSEAARERKRKADKSFVKPIPKRRVSTTTAKNAVGILASKPASTTSSVSNRRISFDPALLAARRSSRTFTVQITNETQERIISAAARRATLSVMPRREQTPPLTQEERLAQAVLTEKENKMSLKRIVEAEEERARKRREKLEALRRKHFNEPIVRFISRRKSVIEEIPEDVEIIDDEEEKLRESITVKEEAVEQSAAADSLDNGGKEGENADIEAAKPDESALDSEKMDIDVQPEANSGEKQTTLAVAVETMELEAPAPSNPPVDNNGQITDGSSAVPGSRENVDLDEAAGSEAQVLDKKTQSDSDTHPSPKNATSHDVSQEGMAKEGNDEPETLKTEKENDSANSEKVLNDTEEALEIQKSQTEEPSSGDIAPATPPVKSPSISGSPKPIASRSPSPPQTPPYHEAHFTANTVSVLFLPGTPPQTARDTFFPSVPLVAPPKPKPCARCPITGLPARYKDPFSGVGYYDIHAFKILREVGRKGSRYVWCSEGGWFVGETGWGGRGAKGVPEGWSG